MFRALSSLSLDQHSVLCAVFDDGLSGHYADQRAEVVRDRDEILVHCAGQKILDGGRDRHRRVAVLFQDLENVDVLELADVHLLPAGGFALHAEDAPEEIPLADGPDVFVVGGDHRDGGVAVLFHGLQCLPDRGFRADAGDIAPEGKKECYVHDDLFYVICCLG